jgi:hypothetical protein
VLSVLGAGEYALMFLIFAGISAIFGAALLAAGKIRA